MKILFFGDSITDSDRDRENRDDLGTGYVKILAGKLRPLYPDMQFTFVNRGVGGDGTEELLARMQTDVIDEKPDVVVLAIGINDVWRNVVDGAPSDNEFSENYAAIVRAIQATGAKLILIQPYLLKHAAPTRQRACLSSFNAIIRGIAAAERLPMVPMDEIFNGVTQDIDPMQFSVDGIHPTHRGCRYIADCVIKELKKYVV